MTNQPKKNQQKRTQKEGIAGKDCTIVSILDIITNASLCMTMSPQSLNGQGSNLEFFLVLDHIIDLGNTSIRTKDGQTRFLGNQFDIASCVIHMMMCAQHRGQFRAQMLKDVHQLLRLDWIDDGCLGGLFIEDNVCVVIYKRVVFTERGFITNGSIEGVAPIPPSTLYLSCVGRSGPSFLFLYLARPELE